jgi:hypothetical protein
MWYQLVFVISIVVVPLIVVISYARLKRPDPPATYESLSGGYVTFHQAEFTALKSEIAELVKAAASNFQYAILASGGMFAWLLTSDLKTLAQRDAARGELMSTAVFLPYGVSALFGALSLAGFVRIGEMATYLRALEKKLACSPFGWETYFSEHKIMMGAVFSFGWVLLLGGDLYLALRLRALFS